MAPARLRAVQSQMSINVSRNFQSPVSSPQVSRNGQASIQVPDSVQLVEDSLEDIPKRYREGAFPPAPPLHQDDDDDLYGLSPKGVETQERARLSGERASPTTVPASPAMQLHGELVAVSASQHAAWKPNGSTGADSRPPGSSLYGSQKGTQVSPKANQLNATNDDSISAATTVGAQRQLSSRSITLTAGHSSSQSIFSKEQLEATTALAAKPIVAPTHTRRAGAAQKPSATKKSAPVASGPKMSAMAALQHRKAAKSAQSATAAPRASARCASVPRASAPRASASRASFSTVKSQVSTPAQVTSSDNPKVDGKGVVVLTAQEQSGKQSSAQTPTRRALDKLSVSVSRTQSRAGKLLSVRKGMFGKIPVAGRPPATLSKEKRKRADSPSYGEKTSSSRKRAKAPDSVAMVEKSSAEGPGSLKRVARAPPGKAVPVMNEITNYFSSPQTGTQMPPRKASQRTAAKGMDVGVNANTSMTKAPQAKAKPIAKREASVHITKVKRPPTTAARKAKTIGIKKSSLAKTRGGVATRSAVMAASGRNMKLGSIQAEDASAQEKPSGGLAIWNVDSDYIVPADHFVVDSASCSQSARKALSESRTEPQCGPAITQGTQRAFAQSGNEATRSTDNGNAQDAAIEIPDELEPSSPYEPTPPHVQSPVRQGPEETAACNPETPLPFKSSPPITQRANTNNASGQLVADSPARRSNIISFGKTGPRNQGTSSIKKSRGTASITHFSTASQRERATSAFPSSRTQLNARHGTAGHSSAATSMKSTGAARQAPPSNIAEHVDDALADFTSKADNREPASTTSSHRSFYKDERKRHLDQIDALARDDDDGFITIDAYDIPTLVGKKLSPQRLTLYSQAAPSASQQAMPPPSAATYPQSQHEPPTVPSMLATTSCEPESLPSGIVRSEGLMKPAVDIPGELVAKKRRAESRPAIEHDHKRAKVEDATGSDKENRQPDQWPLTQHAIAQIVPASSDPLQSTRKPLIPRAKSQQGSEPVKPQSRITSRVASTGSQKVDIHGSPIPAHMVIPKNTTVLESYSKLAELSSDDPLIRDGGAVRRGVQTTVVTTMPSFASDNHVPTSRQSQIPSSNRKSMPESPKAAAKTMMVGKIVKQKLMVSDAVDQPSDGPFTNSEEARKGSSGFVEQLRRRMSEQQAPGTETRVRTELNGPEDDPDRTLVNDDHPDLDATTDDKDLTAWRNGLLPHQVNVFDELVGISRRLVQWLDEEDTAGHKAVSEYCDRGQTLADDNKRRYDEANYQRATALKQQEEELERRLVKIRRELAKCVSIGEKAVKKVCGGANATHRAKVAIALRR